MNRDPIATYYKDFPLKKPQTRLTRHELDLYYAVMEVKNEHDRQALAEFNPNLNVWEAVNLAGSELKHCSFLRWLLDPRGSHYQGDLFLKSFIERFSESFPREIPKDELSSCKVKSEDFYHGVGRVDISITGRSFIIVIEAKIDAGEQEDQVSRYGQLRQDSPKNVVIVFLTKDGRKPNFGPADLCIKWKNIGEICKEFVKECKNPWLAELVRQYSIMSDTL